MVYDGVPTLPCDTPNVYAEQFFQIDMESHKIMLSCKNNFIREFAY